MFILPSIQVSYDPRSYERNCVYRSLKISGVQRGLNMPVRRSDQPSLSYEITDVGSCSFVANEPVRNECEVIT